MRSCKVSHATAALALIGRYGGGGKVATRADSITWEGERVCENSLLLSSNATI